LALNREKVLKNFDTAIDLIYKPDKTLFLKLAKENGLKTINGLCMLGIGKSQSQLPLV